MTVVKLAKYVVANLKLTYRESWYKVAHRTQFEVENYLMPPTTTVSNGGTTTRSAFAEFTNDSLIRISF